MDFKEDSDGKDDQLQSLDLKEQKMREEIRVLQEKRASVLQQEVEDLKRQRDKALSKANRLEDTLRDLRAENTALTMDSETRANTQLELLEQTLLEEQREKEELIKKLQTTTKQNSSLLLRLSKVEKDLEHVRYRRVSRDTVSIPFLSESILSATTDDVIACDEDDIDGDGDLDDDGDDGDGDPIGGDGDGDGGDGRNGEIKAPSTNSETGQEELLSPTETEDDPPQVSPHPPPGTSSDPKTTILFTDSSELAARDLEHLDGPLARQRYRRLSHNSRKSPLIRNQFSSLGDLTRSLGTSPSDTTYNSPSMKTKRYVLASSTKRDTWTQTVSRSTAIPSGDRHLSDDVHLMIQRLEDTVDVLTGENEDLSQQLRRAEEELRAGKEKYQTLAQALKTCNSNLETLRCELKEVTKWSVDKMADIKEDLDIAKIIYSLHGSLSQESTAINSLCQKLKDSQTDVGRLKYENSCIKLEMTKLQKKYQDLKQKTKYLSPRKQAPPTAPHQDTSPLTERYIRSLHGAPPPLGVQLRSTKGPQRDHHV